MDKVLIIGGGAAGIMAALTAKKSDNRVTIIEKNKVLGQKLSITGSGRCNVTNTNSREEFFENINTNAKFLYSSFSKFSNYDMMDYLKSIGVDLKCEGSKVYPASESAQKLVNALVEQLEKKGAQVNLNEELEDFEIGERDCKSYIKTIITSKKTYRLESGDYTDMVLTTGGLSYTKNKTFDILKSKNIAITPMYPSLTSVDTIQDLGELSGISVSPAICRCSIGGKTYAQEGDILFTKKGLSGPCILNMTGKISCYQDEKKQLTLYVDFLPSVGLDQLQAVVFDHTKKLPRTKLSAYLPSKLCKFLLGKYDEVDLDNLKKEEKAEIIARVKNCRFDIRGFGSIKTATVTKGGVEVRQVCPKTLRFKDIQNLYIAGECLDIDGSTGGYNLQLAFSTGYSVGLNF